MMKFALIVCLIILSGCATSPEFLRRGLGSIVLTPSGAEEQQTQRLLAANPNMSISRTNCRSNRDGSLTCTTIGQ